MKNYKLFPKITVWLLMILGLVATGAFFVTLFLEKAAINDPIGVNGYLDVAGDSFLIPVGTDVLLYWIYALVALAVLFTFGFVLIKFFSLCRTDLKKALLTLCVLALGVGLCVVCWFLGSPEKITITGYEGADNVGAMARMSDAILYLTYILGGATVLTWAVGLLYTKLKK
jgi:hypothetical protein